MIRVEIVEGLRQRGHVIGHVAAQGIWMPWAIHPGRGVWVDWAAAEAMAAEPSAWQIHYAARQDGRHVQSGSLLVWADSAAEAEQLAREACRRRRWTLEVRGVEGGSVRRQYGTGALFVPRYIGQSRVSL